MMLAKSVPALAKKYSTPLKLNNSSSAWAVVSNIALLLRIYPIAANVRVYSAAKRIIADHQAAALSG